MYFHSISTDPSGDRLNLALVQYTFSSSPHPIIQKPHGNSKERKPFVRTAPSTLQKLKECSKTQTAKRAIFSVTEDKGGVINAKAVGDLPHNRKQIYNIQSRETLGGGDALLSVMAMCKQSLGKDDDPFVRIVTSAPEPMCVLCTNSQLADIERFCTDYDTSYPLSVDPTFDLGDFSVTVTSYRHLLLQNRRNTANSPVMIGPMIGPMLVHRRKFFSSYHFFASSLVSLRPGISELRAFGTDGEEELYRAFSAQFPGATHLRCFLHFRDNCKAKLQQLGVTGDAFHDIIQDILGSFIRGKRGLVDSADAVEFHALLQSLKEKWESGAPGFFDWFVTYKAQSLVSSMIQPLRESAGLGSPPGPFYTNDIESVNRVIKRKTNYKTSEWPEFCKLAQQLVKEQESDIEKAVIGIGEYRFKDEYKHLEIPLRKWGSMSATQREKHLKKIAAITMCQAQSKEVRRCGSSGDSHMSTTVLSMCDHQFNAPGLKLPPDILQNMFSKAEKLVTGANCIVSAPGTSTAKLVESKSGQRPHYVTRKGSHRYCCDSDCPMWKCSKVCSHTLACAFIDQHLQQFIDHLSGSSDAPNLYALAKSDTVSKQGKNLHDARHQPNPQQN